MKMSAAYKIAPSSIYNLFKKGTYNINTFFIPFIIKRRSMENDKRNLQAKYSIRK